ncbi:MAG: SpoIID/LytB domain-containing protein [Pseudobdellovibrio sp.]
MRNLNFIIVGIALGFSSYSSAQLSVNKLHPEFVRIRMFKELSAFPEIKSGELKRINRSVWSITGDNLEFDGKKLPSTNVVVLRNDNKFDLISIIDFNEYIAGVVSQEMPASWPLEALKAQAVVARSFALARIKERHQKYFHLESDQADQVYQINESPKAMQAVFETDNMVLETPAGQILKAYYHSDCGGQTVKASDVWGAKAFDSGTAVDPWCAAKISNRWSFETSREDFLNKLNLDEGRISAQENLEISNKSQIFQIAENVFSVQKIRQIFGFSQVRSSINKIEFNADKIRISGQGYGHGAGLCQWGSLAQARMGKSYIQVLSHYYPKAKMSRESLHLSMNEAGKPGSETVSN